MTSHPPAHCCTVGVFHEGEPRGEIREVANVSTYLAYPPDRATDKAILFLTDAMGHRFVNAQLLADQFAAHGYLVVMPDLFAGDPIPLNYYSITFDIWDWYRHHLPPRVDPIVDGILTAMRETLGCQLIGGVGYCFGGKYVCRYLQSGKLDAGFIAHPTGVEVDELRRIEGPLSIAAAITDAVFTADKRHASEAILGGLGVPFQINLFSDVEHGFAVRCDLSETRQKFAKEQAFSQAVAWFEQHIPR
ncbi:alpha/beta-hydrolase [Aspergillus heteromorphus CBS 117.55]|uniref:Alpha/beta-hydrolase n=1 Tax=Aspergillus heteromorphus CBS 117.55 TaxID=1448321 RepID=A0A317WVW3_9EURO|nr:alpha/beta-hydrolase [Aspergillus heteromorphus CBS 117.55]PWY90235.1 alpha/beta-hydrolase [Aspergillus heteromorphus CBS 117.55]